MTTSNARSGLVFSVVLPVYEQPDTARMALECLQAQKDAPPFEVIVCDDGSSPETFAACHEVIRNASVPVYWAWQQDRGFRLSASRNNGIRMASGRYLLLLDGDMIAEEDLLAGHLAMHTRPGMVVQGNRLWRSLELVRPVISSDAEAIRAMLRSDAAVTETLRQEEDKERRRRKHILRRGNLWRLSMANNLSVERRDEVYLDEEFRGWGMEDNELGLRLISQGFEIVYDSHLITYHLQGAMNSPAAGANHESLVGTLRNIVYLSEKWPNVPVGQNHLIMQLIELDPATDRFSWRRGEVDPNELPRLYDEACDWLRRQGMFPAIINR